MVLLGTIGYLLSVRYGFVNPLAQVTDSVQTSDGSPLTFDQAVVYTCAGSSSIAAAFKTGDTDIVELSLPDMNPALLTKVAADAGVKYTNEAGLIMWEQDGVVRVENPETVLYTNCVSGQVNEPLPEMPLADELVGTEWVWKETIYATGTKMTPKVPDDFSITFSENQRFSANTDCNNVGGAYVGGGGGALSFAQMVSTLMACSGDVQEGAFVAQLGEVVSYRLEDAALVLTLKSDEENGEMIFSKK